jgi:P-aminobenzoate N-oxygenase AurF
MLTIAQNYQSHSDSWEDNASIRTRPRREVEEDKLNYYPIERQPLCTHPRISELQFEKVNYVLLQSLYKYLNDIIIFETEIVNKTAKDIAKARFPFDFPFACRYDAMSVVIDEDYHAYVAMDYIHQVMSRTGVVPITLPDKIELSIAIPETIQQLPQKYRAGMELIAVAISENTVTADVAAFARDSSVKRSLKGLMSDHLVDEGRHSMFWTHLVKLYWLGIDEDARLEIGKMIPVFLKRYLTNKLQFEFDCRLVASLNLESNVEVEITRDIVSSYPITNKHPMIGNIISFLQLSGVLEHIPTKLGLSHFFLVE